MSRIHGSSSTTSTREGIGCHFILVAAPIGQLARRAVSHPRPVASTHPNRQMQPLSVPVRSATSAPDCSGACAHTEYPRNLIAPRPSPPPGRSSEGPAHLLPPRTSAKRKPARLLRLPPARASSPLICPSEQHRLGAKPPSSPSIDGPGGRPLRPGASSRSRAPSSPGSAGSPLPPMKVQGRTVSALPGRVQGDRIRLSPWERSGRA